MTERHDIEDERRELVLKKYRVGLTEDEERRLAEIRVELDRIEADRPLPRLRPPVAFLQVGYLPPEFVHRNHLRRANRLAVRRAMPRGLYRRTPWGRA